MVDWITQYKWTNQIAPEIQQKSIIRSHAEHPSNSYNQISFVNDDIVAVHKQHKFPMSLNSIQRGEGHYGSSVKLS